MHQPFFQRTVLDTSFDFVSARPRILFEYWKQKCGPRPRPRFDEIDLMDVYEIAPYIVIKDVIEGGKNFAMRFWGTGVRNTVGIEGTGKTARDLYSGDNREHINEAFKEVIRTGKPIRVLGRVSVDPEKDYLVYEGVHLPLDDGAGNISRLISAYTFGTDENDLG
jgi:hypothetical protein